MFWGSEGALFSTYLRSDEVVFAWFHFLLLESLTVQTDTYAIITLKKTGLVCFRGYTGPTQIGDV